MIRRFVMGLFAALFAIATAAYSLPQDNQSATQDSATAATQPKHEHGKHGRQDPAKQTQRMTKKLNLSSDQQSKVQGILEDQQKQMETLHQDKSLSKQDRQAKFADLRQNTSSQIRGLLNADQQKKFDAMEQKREQKMAKHRAGKAKTQSLTETQPK